MRQTISQSIRNTAPQPSAPFFGKVLRADPISRTVDVNLEGATGLRFVRVADNIDMGTEANPLVSPGDEVKVEPVGRQMGSSTYVVTALFRNNQSANPGNAGGTGRRALGAPEWTRLRIIGTNLDGQWTVVPGATLYTVYANSVANPNGASPIATVVGNNYNATLNPSGSTQVVLQNLGFESGNITGWQDGSSSIVGYVTISGSTVRSGCYAARFEASTGSGTSFGVTSPIYPISPCARVNTSAWVYMVRAASAVIVPYAGVNVNWYSGSTAIATVACGSQTGSSSGWVNLTASAISPSNANGFDFKLGLTVGFLGTAGSALAYFDDVSMLGRGLVYSSSLLYAVRAFNDYGDSSPFSNWLQPIQNSAALGSPNTDHILFDGENTVIYSSNFVSGASGFQVSPSGISGNFIGISSSLLYAASTLGGNFALTGAGTWYNVLSVSLSTGVWMIAGNTTIDPAGYSVSGARIWNGATVFASAQCYDTLSQHIGCNAIVNITSASTIYFSCVSVGGGGTAYATTPTTSTGSATNLIAVRLG